MAITSVGNSTPQDIFGSHKDYVPFSPGTITWFGGGEKSQGSPPATESFKAEEGREKQSDVPDVVLNTILTAPVPEIVPFT